METSNAVARPAPVFVLRWQTCSICGRPLGGPALFASGHYMHREHYVPDQYDWLPRFELIERQAAQNRRSTMLVAKGSLFLGRMTALADGMSVLLEPSR